jgi:hypothetical protein
VENQNVKQPVSEQHRDEAGLEVPKISLPKGGGALSGIGEKFGKNPSREQARCLFRSLLVLAGQSLVPSFRSLMAKNASSVSSCQSDL